MSQKDAGIVEIACKEMVFHFNKKHLEDQTIPMWVVKTRGETLYVEHVDCSVPWSTKETPDNNHTKGSIKIKNCLLTIDQDNCAQVMPLSDSDRERLSGKKKTVRIITKYGQALRKFLENRKHSAIKTFGGACSTTWYVCDLPDERVLLLARMVLDDVRVLMPNEDYYRWYEKFEDDYIDEDNIDWGDLYEE